MNVLSRPNQKPDAPKPAIESRLRPEVHRHRVSEFWRRMKTVLLLSALLAATGCRPLPSQDEIRFDSLLATGRIDHIVFVGGPYHLTNEAWDRTCQLFLRLMNSTNRVGAQAASLRDPPTDRVLFQTGTNVLGDVSYHRAAEMLQFGAYSFRLKEATNYHQWFSP
jgi:hypothetical protein